MEHIAAILLLVACSDDLAQCREIPAPVPYYETAAECEGALEPAMFALAVRHPQVFGQCVAVDPADEEADVELVWEIATDGTFIASLEPSGIMIASAGEGDGNRN